MSSISFKNFRRFSDFPELKLGRSTILVGGNNCGKSTLLKAIKFIVSNLKNFTIPEYYISDIGRTCHIPEFTIYDNGIYGNTHKNDTDQPMSFTISCGKFFSHEKLYKWAKTYDFSTIDRYVITVEFKPAQHDAKNVQVDKIIIEDRELGFRLTCMLNWSEISELNDEIRQSGLVYKDEENEYDKQYLHCWAGFIVKLEWVSWEGADIPAQEGLKEMTADKFLCYYREDMMAFDNDYIIDTGVYDLYLKTELDRLNTILEARNDDGSLTYDKTLWFSADEFNHNDSWTYPSSPANDINDVKNIKDLLDYIYIHGDKLYNTSYFWRLKESSQDLMEAVSSLVFSPTIITGSRIKLYQPHDKAFKLINDFYNIQGYECKWHKQSPTGSQVGRWISHAVPGDREYPFRPNPNLETSYASRLRELLRRFEVAQDFKITQIEGYDAYAVKIQMANGVWVDLAEAGTGSIKLFELFLNILTAKRSSILYIEEPEQNLHPKLQSRLADLFNEFDLQCIIETHSEYLIRRTQVLVAQSGFTEDDIESKCPFKVYYFPEDSVPYDMKYLPSGRFQNKFGRGFFDEAAGSALEISKLERHKKNG